ncbi:MAG: QueT transporter family protein [Clostridia bacterium]|nr:QueT transporter family protein [Clostridia bacterium]
MKTSIKKLTISAIIAALYAVLTLLLAPISFGAVQCRIAECLCVLPIFTPYAIPGLFIGCLISNIIGGMGIFDIVFGSLTTLIAAFFTYKFKKNIFIALFFPVILNALIVGAYLSFLMSESGFSLQGFLVIALEVGLGQLVSCYGLGLPLASYLKKSSVIKF